MTTYVHPKNKNFTISDTPGYGTADVPMDTFLKIVDLSKFDYSFICFNPVLRHADLSLEEKLQKKNIPFSLIRTKLYIDFGETAIDTRINIVNKIRESLTDLINKKNKLTQNC